MNLIPKIKLSTNRLAHYIYPITVLAVVLIIYYLSYFLYNNFYIAISQSELVVLLKRDVATEVVDMGEFKNVNDALDRKLTPHDITITNNPFN